MATPSGPHLTPPNVPNVPTPPSPTSGAGPAGPEESLSNSPWARMFPGGATPQQLRMFINSFLKMMIYEFKRSDEQWQQSQERLKQVEEGNDPDS